MKRLQPRLPRRRAKLPQAPEGTTAEVQSTEVHPAVPAGAEPQDPAAVPRPSFRNRGRLRRRLRFLRRVRELGFRDLGGLVFDQHRFDRFNEELVLGKVAAIAAVDAELRALEQALGDRRDITELREPGLSACPSCGTLHSSDARFCPSCGLALKGARSIAPDIGEGQHRTASPPELPAGDPGRAYAARPAVEPRAAEPRSGEKREAEKPASAPDGVAGGDDQPTVVARPGAEHSRP